VSAVSELEVREWVDEQGAGAEEAGAGGTTVSAHARLHGARRNGLGAWRSSFLCSFLCPSRSLILL